MTKVLKTIGPYERKGRGGKKTHTPLFPELSQYWCRHTWATIAAELDIPKETIAAALGHDMGNPTTAIYINFNQKKVDEANRKVIDFLNEK
jgi:integrase